MQRPAPANLPPLDPASLEHSAAAADHLRAAIRAASGWLPFDHWMAEALYAPGLGYYAAGNVKLADPADAAALPAGDFVTAPQLTPRSRARWRARPPTCWRRPARPPYWNSAPAPARWPKALRELDALGQAHTDYLILEVSADLRAVQAKRLAPSRACAGLTRCRRPLGLRAGQRSAGRHAGVVAAGAKTQCRWNAAWPWALTTNSSGKTARPARAGGRAGRAHAGPARLCIRDQSAGRGLDRRDGRLAGTRRGAADRLWLSAQRVLPFLMNAGLMELLAQLDPSDAAARAPSRRCRSCCRKPRWASCSTCWRWAVASPRRCASRAATGSASSEPGRQPWKSRAPGCAAARPDREDAPPRRRLPASVRRRRQRCQARQPGLPDLRMRAGSPARARWRRRPRRAPSTRACHAASSTVRSTAAA